MEAYGVYTNMKQWNDIRQRVLVQGESKRQILRETGMHWTTLEKILTHSSPPGYRASQPRHRPKLGPHVDWIGKILELDKMGYLLSSSCHYMWLKF